MESASTLREMVNRLDLHECTVLRDWLKARIQLLNKRPFTELSIDELSLSASTKIILWNENIRTVKDIISKGISQISIIKGIGRIKLDEIRKCIEMRLPKAFMDSLPDIPWDIDLRKSPR